MAWVSIVGKPSFQSWHLRHGIDKSSVSFSPFVQHAGRATSGSSWRKIVRHVHDAMTEHLTWHQRIWQRRGGTWLVVLRTRRHCTRFLLFYRQRGRGGGRGRLLILGPSRQRERSDGRTTWRNR